MASKFDGRWRNEYTQNGQTRAIEYEFKGKEFSLSSTGGAKLYGHFAFTDDEVSFDVFSEGAKWTQKYFLTEEHLDLRVDGQGHFNGRFFKATDPETNSGKG